MNHSYKKSNKGFVILFSVLISTLILLISSGTTGSETQTFQCGGDTVTSYFLEGSGGSDRFEIPYVLRYYNSFDQSGCAYVLVEKNEKGTDTTLMETRVTAVGFNVCVNSSGGTTGRVNIPDFNDPTLLERRLSITYTR